MTRRGPRTVVLLAVALLVALITEALVTITTFYIPSAGDYYGAPIPVGISCFDIPLGRPDCSSTFSSLLFAADVLLTWPLWYLIGRWSGVVGLLGALAGSLVSVALIPVMLEYGLPIVGLPLPLGRWSLIPNALTIWVDVVIWGCLASALVRALRPRV